MTDKIDPELLQPEDTVKPKRTRKLKVEETIKETPSQYTYEHPGYDMYQAYQKYFEQQQKTILEYWTAVLNNIWNPGK